MFGIAGVQIGTQVIAFIGTFILAVVAGPIFIPMLRKLEMKQTVRDDGPESHLKKGGTPTIGAIIFLVPITICSVISTIFIPQIIPVLILTLSFGGIGFLDDWLKASRQSKDGLKGLEKMGLLLFVSILFVVYITFYTDIKPELIIPFLGVNNPINISWFVYAPLAVFVLLSTTNCVNLTDGLDGLAGGVTMVVMIFFTFVAIIRPEWADMKVFSAIVAGGCFGFLIFNISPAKVFMGDTGSLALGGAVGGISIIMNMPIIIIIAGMIYVLEGMSVILQVGSFKLTGKRIFKMAPLHHHFELSGWKEQTVVMVFWLATVVFCAIAIISVIF